MPHHAAISMKGLLGGEQKFCSTPETLFREQLGRTWIVSDGRRWRTEVRQSETELNFICVEDSDSITGD